MRPEPTPNYLLQVVLAVFGAAIVFLGLNVGLGGIETLGWQGGSVSFFSVANEAVFAIRDSHIRFIGGVWLGLGLVMIAGSLAFQRLRTVLIAFMAMIFVGGVARLSGNDLSLLLGPDLAPSFILEVIVVPLLGLWALRAERGSARRGEQGLFETGAGLG